jgi:hypothetical protein
MGVQFWLELVSDGTVWVSGVQPPSSAATVLQKSVGL